MSVLDGIGNTPLVALRNVVPKGSATVLAKLEWANPTGSMKDRMALAVVQAAERDGRLSENETVVEYTAGTTGISLAVVCAAKGYRMRIVFSDAFSPEKGQMMEALGVELSIVPSDNGKINAKLIREMIDTASRISSERGHWWVDQLNNRDAVGGYHALGEEIWQQSAGRVNAFVHAVGTAHSIHGAGDALKSYNSELEIVAVEPAESAVLSGGGSGSHKIEGIGIGFIPPLWEPHKVDDIQQVSTSDAKEMARRLAREEGVFAGISSGANVVAALRLAERLGPNATVATIICDSGLRYLSTDVYRRATAPA